MALFGRGKEKDGAAGSGDPNAHPVMARDAFCRVCGDRRRFSRCWLRAGHVMKCPCCGLDFGDPAPFYERFQPACPECGEPLEQPGFEYGYCDGCTSKFEIVPGGKPGLLPNKEQRARMDKLGRVWRME